MLGDLLVLIGMGLFLKVFFGVSKKAETEDKNQRNKLIIIHVILGIAFIIVGRIIVK